MLAFARFALHSPTRTMFLAGVASFFPIAGFFGQALVALVWLRMGPSFGLRIALAASIGSIFNWYYFASPEGVFTLLGLVLLAEVLRAKASWVPVLLVGTALAGFLSLSYTWLPLATQEQLLTLIFQHQGWEEAYQLTATETERLKLALAQLLNGVITSLQFASVLLCLMLARYWQAGLYNPGGFGQEFINLRLPLAAGLLIILALGLVLGMQLKLLALTPVVLVAHIFAGLALIHAWFKLKKYNSFWLGLVYLMLVTFQPYFSFLLITLALADSWFNFRAKLAPKPASEDQANQDSSDD